MKLKIYINSLLIVFVGFLFSCGENKKTNKSLTEGEIDFTCTVIDESNPMAGFAPGNATANFKDNNLQIEMSVMGMLNTSFISKPSAKTLTQMVKFLDIKSACIQTEKELVADNLDYQLNLEETKETKVIAGYKCHKVNATMVNNPTEKFEVYYTPEIGGDSINCLGPYSKIKGMLLQYRLKKLGLELCFTANTVKKVEIKSEVFDIPSYYKIVTRSEMDAFFSDLQK